VHLLLIGDCWIAYYLKKSIKVDPKQKKPFFAMSLKAANVNFLLTIWFNRKHLEAKIYNGMQKNMRKN
jgi:hypothetical protein